MILDTYLLVKQNMKQNNQDFLHLAQDSDDTVVMDSRIAYGNMQSDYTTSTILMLILSIILAIFVAYIFFTCIKSNCMSFLVFVIFLVLLNIPVVNIFALIGLFIYWLVYCRKGCKITK